MIFTKKIQSFLEKYLRFISWHILPSQDDLKIKSFVEVLFYFVIFLCLLFIYNCWHEVPVRNIVIVAEYDNSQSKTGNDTLFKGLDVALTIPMTDTPLDSNKQFKITLDLIKTYRKTVCCDNTIDSFTLNKDTKILFNNLKYNNNKRDAIGKKYPLFVNNDILYFGYGYSRNPLNSLRSGDFFIYNKDDDIPSCEHIIETKDLYSRQDYSCIIDAPYGIVINNIYSSGDLASPVWYRLEDISQTYFNIRLNTNSIDSLSLKIDFVGVTELSHMIPEPDDRGMGYIKYYNPEKIQTICKSGLLFHAHFKELENKQTVRLYFVTTVLGGIVIIGTAILFVAIYRIFRWSKRNKGKGLFLIICVILLLLWYFNVLYVIYERFKYDGTSPFEEN